MNRLYRNHDELLLHIALVFEEKPHRFTRTQIARKLGYKSTSSIFPILDELEQRGLLAKLREGRPQGGVRYIYERRGHKAVWVDMREGEGLPERGN